MLLSALSAYGVDLPPQPLDLERARNELLVTINALPKKVKPNQGDDHRELSASLQNTAILRELTPQESDSFYRLMDMFGNAMAEETIATPPSARESVTVRALQRLDKEWLDDSVINAYFRKLRERAKRLHTGEPHTTTWFTSTFFMTKLMDLETREHGIGGEGKYGGRYNYSAVETWGRKCPMKNIFLLDKLCIPVNFSGDHWMLCVVFMEDKAIWVYDSLLRWGYNTAVLRRMVFRYLQDEHCCKTQKRSMTLEEVKQWKFVDKVWTAPQQLNLRDCGVFTILFGEYMARKCQLDDIATEVRGMKKYCAMVQRCRLRVAATLMNDDDLT